MSGTHQYEMILKKNSLFINLLSDDVQFISKQMHQWCQVLLDGYQPPVSKTMVIATESVPPPIIEQTIQPPVTPPVQTVIQPVAAPQAQPQPEPVLQAAPPQQQVAGVTPVAQPVPLSQPMATTPTPLASLPSPPIEAAMPASNDFEAVMDSLMKDLEEPEVPLSIPPLPQNNPNAAVALPFQAEFNLAAASLAEWCEKANPSHPEAYLLLSAYFLTRIEHQQNFSLKKINSALVKSGLTPVNHSILESALSKGYLSMVPDLTGTADVTEYTMTPDGQQAAACLL